VFRPTLDEVADSSNFITKYILCKQNYEGMKSGKLFKFCAPKRVWQSEVGRGSEAGLESLVRSNIGVAKRCPVFANFGSLGVNNLKTPRIREKSEIDYGLQFASWGLTRVPYVNL